MYKRIIKKQVIDSFFKGKVLIIVGPRQVGKTTLSEEIIKHFDKTGNDTVIFNCDNPSDRSALDNKDFENLDRLIGKKKIIFIDEGQKVASIGQSAKLMIDKYKTEKQIIITGSSAINLLSRTEETLTGRKKTFYLFPLSIAEVYPSSSSLSISKELETTLLCGLYPEVMQNTGLSEKIKTLQELTSSNLYKDILEFDLIKNSAIIFNLLKALALQIGSEVSYNELANMLGIDRKTVERYVDLLEKNYIVFRLAPFYSNKRKEISKSKKIYFYDLGIRNAIINSFNFLDTRTDVGGLWENFLIIERLKHQKYTSVYSNNYFWHAYAGKEIDWVEEREGKLFAYEFKWKSKGVKVPKDWVGTYPDSEFLEINQDNYLDFIC